MTKRARVMAAPAMETAMKASNGDKGDGGGKFHAICFLQLTISEPQLAKTTYV